MPLARTIDDHFSSLTDPRYINKSDHILLDIITITICAVICGADMFTEIEAYGKAKYDWFKRFLELPSGIPSHDTFNRVFLLLNPNEFQSCFQQWIKTVASVTSGEIIAIDGKTLRRSHDRSANKAAIHMVNAWACHNGLSMGQYKTDQKSNEITAIPKLLKMLEISGCIVTIDAMGCQKKIASLIIQKEADYALALKGNQGNLSEEVELYFKEALQCGIEDYNIQSCETVDGDHGRIETRRCYTCSDIEWLEEGKHWPGLKTVVMIESERCIDNVVSKDARFYISSLHNNPEHLLHVIRSHWGVENSLHWVLDVAFREDECRIRKGHGAENFSMLRTIAVNLLRKERSDKRGIKGKRLRAGWDNDYLLKVLAGA
ncbi:MAG: ISAs1 family transposase [Candidatus Marinimicrobia bacterium]|nr:ISAs1 family transposase [Deltaproteobacteria bacterium]MBT4253944.1 ISAs1 family transposase [Candidatus Neomarinimicrobiota bacterium]MBT4944954.1 ISAs1 family transposase [Candidatus Neomarinimicrobiota bacterium]MBT5539955.1 ISAs1 family transposase [Candidatus Neomarinimicrobiota bacterium]MBT7685366.1 ISAs1 family transposase [Candidatus Neomarinimicrobiota bacterium]